MFKKILHFIKYNNAAVIILALVLILGGGALAAGPEAIGQKQTSVQGLDNTALLAADLDKFSLDFKIDNIEQDEKYYYATYSYLDLVILEKAWQYQLNSKTQKVSKKIKQDIGEYLAKFLVKHYEARIRELKQEKNQAEAAGAQKRVEVTEYSGLVGRTLDIAAKVFPGYEPVKKRELPTPENFELPKNPPTPLLEVGQARADNLTQIYNNYVAAHPEIFVAPVASTTVASSTPAQADLASSTADSLIAPPVNLPAQTGIPIPEALSIPEPASVNVIELPAVENVIPDELAPAPAQ